MIFLANSLPRWQSFRGAPCSSSRNLRARFEGWQLLLRGSFSTPQQRLGRARRARALRPRCPDRAGRRCGCSSAVTASAHATRLRNRRIGDRRRCGLWRRGRGGGELRGRRCAETHSQNAPSFIHHSPLSPRTIVDRQGDGRKGMRSQQEPQNKAAAQSKAVCSDCQTPELGHFSPRRRGR